MACNGKCIEAGRFVKFDSSDVRSFFLFKSGFTALLKIVKRFYDLNDVDIFLFFCHRSYDQLSDTKNEGIEMVMEKELRF